MIPLKLLESKNNCKGLFIYNAAVGGDQLT